MRVFSAFRVALIGAVAVFSLVPFEASLHRSRDTVVTVELERETAEPEALAFNAYHFSGRPPPPGLGPPRRSAPSGGLGPQRDFGPYWPIGATGPPIGTSSMTGQDPYWPIGLGPPTAFHDGHGAPDAPGARPPGPPR